MLSASLHLGRLLFLSRADIAVGIGNVFLLLISDVAITKRGRLLPTASVFRRLQLVFIWSSASPNCNVFNFGIAQRCFRLRGRLFNGLECAVLTVCERFLTCDIMVVICRRLDVRRFVCQIYQRNRWVLTRYRRYMSSRRFSFSIWIVEDPT